MLPVCPVDNFRVAALFRLYFNIAFLMSKPQDLPGGRAQLQVAIGLAFVTYVLVALVLEEPGRAIGHALVDLIFSGLVFHVALRLVNHPGRFEQAFGALCGSGAILNLAALPIYLARPVEAGQPPSGLAIFAQFLLLVWSLSLFSHVLRHTFDTGKLVSALLAFAYFIVAINLSGWLLPAAA